MINIVTAGLREQEINVTQSWPGILKLLQNPETLVSIRRNACIFLAVAFGVRNRLHLQHSEDYITKKCNEDA